MTATPERDAGPLPEVVPLPRSALKEEALPPEVPVNSKSSLSSRKYISRPPSYREMRCYHLLSHRMIVLKDILPCSEQLIRAL